eukprot:6486699-Amphidinium_carterae.1
MSRQKVIAVLGSVKAMMQLFQGVANHVVADVVIRPCGDRGGHSDQPIITKMHSKTFQLETDKAIRRKLSCECARKADLCLTVASCSDVHVLVL